MRIEGYNIVLEVLEGANLEMVIALNDPHLMKYAGRVLQQNHTLETQTEWVSKVNANPNQRYWGIYELSEFAGTIRLDISNSVGLISLWIIRKFQGHGYGVEAINLVTDYAFKYLNLHRVEAGVLPENTASIKAFQKADFVIEATLKERQWSEGKFVDEIILRRLNVL